MKKLIFTLAMFGCVLSGCARLEEQTLPTPPTPVTEGPTRARPVGYDAANWMARLADDTPLTAIAIPGTHDSATFGMVGLDLPDVSRCQNTGADFLQQLTDGIRFFDLRVGSDGKLHHDYVICFDSWPNAIYIDEVFDRIVSFLDAHPSETALVLIKHEYGNSQNDYLAHVQAAIDAYGNRVYTGTGTDIDLSEVRGRIVLLDGGGNLGRGIMARAMHFGGQVSEGGLYWQNFWDIGTSGMTVAARARMKAEAIIGFNESVAQLDDPTLFCFNWWNKAWNAGSSVRRYAELVESHFYGKWDGTGCVYYPNGVQIMDYYNVDLVYEVIESNWNIR
jgi:uncharacterized protein YceK